jgi:hypothetical protein
MYSDELGRLPVHSHADFTGHEALSSESDLWYAELTRTGPSGSGSPQSTLPSGNGVGDISDGIYSMEQLFYDQLPSNFMSSLGHGTHDGQPPYHQAPRGMQPTTDAHTYQHHSHPSYGNHNPHVIQDPQAALDINTIAMWSNAPTGFE